ncbi:uncharacterized protein METZ01_LOCUS460012 [marine metagenome]|uniref:Uncharacterized protein n=1 Tax=marine metagenome TaxID=408172 RepID=A0A383AJ76_9ZZZZ
MGGRAAGARLSLAKGHPLDSHWLSNKSPNQGGFP